jgi:hypothetical protein
MNAKRVISCTLFGAVAGVICWVGSYVAGGVPGEFSAGMILAIIFNRAFVGFVIGVSGWRAPWALHGIVIGLLGSLPISVYPLLTPGGLGGFIMYELAGGLWGFLIELGARAVGASKK